MYLWGLQNETRQIKIVADEQTVHKRIIAIEEILGREIIAEFNLNRAGIVSHFQMSASESEIRLIHNKLGHLVMVKDGKHWIPYM